MINERHTDWMSYQMPTVLFTEVVCYSKCFLALHSTH